MLLGPNGCGKSTLLKILAGLLSPRGGTVYVKGPKSFVFQNPDHQRFPWFRIGYFSLWTVVYVVFQWIVHACVKLWWPYPFLDLSSPYALLWYLSVAIMHIPCYGIFALIMKLKHFVLSTKYPESYQCMT